MSEPIRRRLACLTYWILFIIVPSLVVRLWLGGGLGDVAIALMIFIGLILVGEHGYPPWRRVWKLADRRNCSLTDPDRF